MSAEEQKTLLLVDDEAIIAMSEKMTLEKYGYQVITALSGEEAVAIVEKTPGIDLILMDINLGAGMDGTEAAAAILKERDLPIVFLSSHTEPAVVEKTEKITSYGYVVKNSSITVLDASIKMAFKLFQARISEMAKEDALKKSERELLEAQKFAHVGSWTYDPATRQPVWSEEMFRIWGLDPRLGAPAYSEHKELIHPEDYPRFDAAVRAAVEHGTPYQLELRIFRPDGSEITIVSICEPLCDAAGRVQSLKGTIQDISKRKLAEEAVYQAKKDWEECFDTITDAITIHDKDYNIIRANKAGKALLGLPEHTEMVKAKCFSYYHGADVPPAGCPSCACLKNGMPGVFELFEPHLGRYLEIRAIPKFGSNDQRVGLIHIVRDITDSKRATEVLKESELRLKAQYQGMPVPTFTWQKRGKDFVLIDFNDAARTIGKERITGFVGRNAGDLYENRHDIVQDLHRCLLEREIIRRETLSEHFVPGEFVALTIVPILPDLVLVQLEDISARKQAESQKETAREALSESEDRYRDLVENSQDLICTHDLDGQILSMNAAAVRLTGYSHSELLGMNMVDLLLPDVRHLFKLYLAEIQAKGWSRGTMRIQTASGEPRYWEYYNTLRTKDVAVPIVRALGHDITERERAEKKQHIQYAIADAMIKSETLSGLLETVRKELGLLIDTTNFLVAVYDESTGLLSAPFERDEKDAIAQWRAEKSLTGLVIKQKRSMLLSKEQIRQMNQAGTIERIGSRAETWLGVPLRTNEKMLGAIVVQSYDKADAYDQNDVSLLEIIANQLSVYIDRKLAEEEIQRQLAEKEVLLKEVHHRIKNNIASVGGLLSMRLQSIANSEAIQVLQEAIGRVDSMRILYDKLLLSEDYKALSVKNYIESLIDVIVHLSPGQARVNIEKHIADFRLDAKRLFPLGLILNELLTNIMKYAFSGRKKGMIEISLSQDAGRVTLTLEDDGVGLPPGFAIDTSKGFGLMLVKMLSQQLRGSFSIESHGGTRSEVEFTI